MLVSRAQHLKGGLRMNDELCVVLIVFLHAIINYLGSYKKNILTKVVSTSETYTFEDFLTSFISILLLTFLVIIPISYFLIKKELKKA